MKYILTILLALVSLTAIFMAPFGVFEKTSCSADRYVSEWTIVPGETVINFQPNLCERPLELHVWIAPQVAAAKFKPAVAIPYLDWPTHALIIEQVAKDIIGVHNTGDEPLFVQVIAVP